jgi:hypothetical protein
MLQIRGMQNTSKIKFNEKYNYVTPNNKGVHLNSKSLMQLVLECSSTHVEIFLTLPIIY